MAVLSVIEQFHLRTGGFAQSAAQSIRIFLVNTDSFDNDESVALFAVDPHSGLTIPAYYDLHPTRSWLYATDIQSRNCADKGSGSQWEVTVNYGRAYVNPWSAPVVVSGDQSAFEKIVDYDLVTKKVVQNSAGFKYDPPLTAQRHNATLVFSKALLDFDTTLPAAWVDSVNSDTWYGVSPGYAICRGIPWSQQVWQSPSGANTYYYQVTFNFEVKNSAEHSWQPIIADQGFYQLNTAGTAVKPILDPLFGQPVTQPWPLDGSGHAQAGPTFTYTGNNYTVYPKQTFATLTALWS